MILFLFLISLVQCQFSGPTDPVDAMQAMKIVNSLVKAWDTGNYTNWDQHFDRNARLETCHKDDYTPKEFMHQMRQTRHQFYGSTIKYGLIYAYRESQEFNGITFKVHVVLDDAFHHDLRITLQEMYRNQWKWVNAWQDNCANPESHAPFVIKEEDLIVKTLKGKN